MSNEMWFNNPGILLNNPDQFIPISRLSQAEKVNSLARFSVYSAIMIWVLDKENKWYYISVGLILFSYLMGKQQLGNETFTQYGSTNPTFNYDNQPNINNLNIFSSNQKNHLNNSKYLQNTKPYNNWNNNNYVNDQSGFASWCYNNDNNQNNNNQNNNNNPSDMIIKNNDPEKNINVYYDKNKINNLNDDTLTIKLHLI